MNPELWRQAETLFHQARTLTEAQHGPWLDRACAAHPDLRPLVEHLLDAEPDAGNTQFEVSLVTNLHAAGSIAAALNDRTALLLRVLRPPEKPASARPHQRSPPRQA